MIQAMIEATLQTAAPDDTASRIIDAAQRLFIRDGTEATSLRAVTREAGVNVAAIHYYFGSRDELLRAVLDRIIKPLNARPLALLNPSRAARRDWRPGHNRDSSHRRAHRRVHRARPLRINPNFTRDAKERARISKE